MHALDMPGEPDGVVTRPIDVTETLVANATRRALRHGEKEVVPRVSDLDALASSTAGKVEGSGEKVTFRATGLAAGTYTIRATASDGKGGTATAQIDISVKQ